MGILGDGGQSIILEYANVIGQMYMIPIQLVLKIILQVANPIVPLQPYNREITVDDMVIPVVHLNLLNLQMVLQQFILVNK